MATDRLREIQGELDGILEERITELLAHMKALREVTSQISATELDIRRHEALKNQLERELAPLASQAEGLERENGEIQRKVDGLRDNVTRMRKLREELMSNLSGLTGELKGLSGGS
jgi:chromosome segregation ATPase